MLLTCLATNQKVGSSNLSGRASQTKKGSHRGPFFVWLVASREVRTPDRQAQFELRPTQSAETTVPRSGTGNLSGRASQMKKGPNGALFHLARCTGRESNSR